MGMTAGNSGQPSTFLGMKPGSTGLNMLKGGLTGLGQGLANYQRPGTGYNFSQLQQGFQSNRPAAGQGATPNAKKLDPFDPNSYQGGPFPWAG